MAGQHLASVLGRHRLAQLVRQHEGRLVLDAEVADGGDDEPYEVLPVSPCWLWEARARPLVNGALRLEVRYRTSGRRGSGRSWRRR